MCGKLCRCCKTCKHCEEYETVDYEYLCPEPAFRCKAKNRDIWFVGMPRPFCNRFETKSESESESLNTFSAKVKKLQDAYINMGSNAESISKILQSMVMTASETRDLVRLETEYKNMSIHKPKSTNCPNCGAPVDIHAEKCAYCDTPYM